MFNKVGNTISVVITTYNGTRYLREQLDSICNQTKKADEVLVMDDNSTDGTAEFVRKYIERKKLDGWKLVINQKNVGWMENFKNGFDLVTGNYIFPCDQDDIWHLDKIEKMFKVMEENRKIEVLASNYHIFTSDNAQIEVAYKNDVHGLKKDGTIEKIPFDVQWCYIKRPGCSYCFRKKFYDEIRDKWDVKFAHDAQLYRWASLRGSLYLLNLILFEYRRHGNNATSNIDKGRDMRIKDIEYYLNIHKNALRWDYQNGEKNKDVLLNNIKFLEMRKECIKHCKLYLWPILVIRYYRNYNSWKGCLLDLACVFLK